MAVNTQTGEFQMLKAEDFVPTSPLTPNVVRAPQPGPDEVLVQGTDEEIQRLSKAIKTLDADEKRKARRKAQRQARKQNR